MNSHGETALLILLKQGKIDACKYLISKGADFSIGRTEEKPPSVIVSIPGLSSPFSSAFDPTDEMQDGLFRYQKAGEPDKWLEYDHVRSAWVVTSIASKESMEKKAWAFVESPKCRPDHIPPFARWTFEFDSSEIAQKLIEVKVNITAVNDSNKKGFVNFWQLALLKAFPLNIRLKPKEQISRQSLVEVESKSKGCIDVGILASSDTNLDVVKDENGTIAHPVSLIAQRPVDLVNIYNSTTAEGGGDEASKISSGGSNDGNSVEDMQVTSEIKSDSDVQTALGRDNENNSLSLSSFLGQNEQDDDLSYFFLLNLLPVDPVFINENEIIHGKSMLMQSIKDGNLALVKYLVTNGVKLDIVDPLTGRNVLHFSLVSGQMHIFEFLLSVERVSSMFFSLDSNRETLLHIACRTENLGAAEILITRYGAICSKDSISCTVKASGMSALEDANSCSLLPRDNEQMKSLLPQEEIFSRSSSKRPEGRAKIRPIPPLVKFLNQKNIDGNTCLHIAASVGNTEFCELVTKHGINIDSTNIAGETALILSAKLRRIKLCMHLVSLGAIVKTADHEGNSALFFALEMLADDNDSNSPQADKSGSEPDRPHVGDEVRLKPKYENRFAFNYSYTSVNEFVGCLGSYYDIGTLCIDLFNNEPFPTFLVKNASGREFWYKKSEIVLSSRTVKTEKEEKIGEEKKWKRDGNAKRGEGDNTDYLFTALGGVPLELLNLLLKNGADTNALGKEGVDPVSLAVAKGLLQGVEALADHGAMLDCVDIKSGYTPLISAIKLNNECVSILLINKGANLNMVDLSLSTPLSLAIGSNLTQICAALIQDKNCNFEICNKDGDYPLHIAIKNDLMDICAMMIARGADVDCMNSKTKQTPLHLAISNKNEKMACFLIEKANLDLDRLNSEFKSYLTLAIQANMPKICASLLENQCTLETYEKGGMYPLTLAVHLGLREVCEVFLNHDEIDINFSDHRSSAPLHTAIENKDDELALLLIEREADVSLLDKGLKSCLTLSIENDLYDVCKALLANNVPVDFVDASGKCPLFHVIHRASLKNFSPGDGFHDIVVNKIISLIDLMIEMGVNLDPKTCKINNASNFALYEMLLKLNDPKYKTVFRKFIRRNIRSSLNFFDQNGEVKAGVGISNPTLIEAMVESRLLSIIDMFYANNIFVDAITLREVAMTLRHEFVHYFDKGVITSDRGKQESHTGHMHINAGDASNMSKLACYTTQENADQIGFIKPLPCYPFLFNHYESSGYEVGSGEGEELHIITTAADFVRYLMKFDKLKTSRDVFLSPRVEANILSKLKSVIALQSGCKSFNEELVVMGVCGHLAKVCRLPFMTHIILASLFNIINFLCRYDGNTTATNMDSHLLRLANCGFIELSISTLTAHINCSLVVEHVCMVIRNLSVEQNKKKLGSEGGIEALLGALTRHQDVPGVVEQACAAISNMACHNASNQDKFGSAGGIEALVVALTRYEDVPNIVRKACGAIRHISSRNSSYQDKFGSAGGYMMLLRALSYHQDNPSVVEEACAAIFYMSINASDLDVLGSEGGIEALLGALTRHQDVPGVVEQACRAIGTMSGNSKSNKEKFKLFDCVNILNQVIPRHEVGSKAQIVASDVLKSLSSS